MGRAIELSAFLVQLAVILKEFETRTVSCVLLELLQVIFSLALLVMFAFLARVERIRIDLGLCFVITVRLVKTVSLAQPLV